MSQSVTKFVEKLFKPIFGEVASVSSGITSSLTFYPYNPDDLVRAKAKGLNIYQEMIREPYVKAALLQKKLKLLKVGWELIPATKDPRDIEIASFVKWNLSTNLAGAFSKDLYEMLDALDSGFSVSEKIWEVVKDGKWKGKTALKDIKSKDPYYLDFEPDEYGNLGKKGLVLNGLMGNKQPLPVNKFIIFSYLMRYENHYGSSDLRAAYRAFWIKDTAWKLRAIYMERFAGNNLKGTYPKNDEKGKEKLLEVFRTWQQETGIALPEGVEIEVLNLATSSASEYEVSIRDANRELQIGILGQTLTMDVGQKGTGSRALGQVHDGVRDDIVWFLDEATSAEVNLQIVRPLVDFNYSTDRYPLWTYKEREGFDGEKFSKTLESLAKIEGVDIPVSWVKTKYRIPEPEDGEPVVVIKEEDKTGGVEGGGGNLWGINLKRAQGKSESKVTAKMGEGEQGHAGPYHRELNRFEVFAEVPRIDVETTELAREGKAASENAYNTIKAAVAKQVEKGELVEKKDYGGIEKIKVPVGDLKAVIADMMIKANLKGRAGIQRLPGMAVKLEEDGYSPDDDLLTMALAVGLLEGEFNSLVDVYTGKAFTLAGLEKSSITNDIGSLLLDVMNSDGDVKDFLFGLDEKMIKYTSPAYGKEGLIGQTILDYHAELVFRNAVMDAYNQGRKAQLEEPEVVEAYPAWMISEVMDGRTREVHASADGLVFLVNDPIWRRLTPPNDHNCRAVIVPISKYDFTRDMLSNHSDIPTGYPGSGFGG